MFFSSSYGLEMYNQAYKMGVGGEEIDEIHLKVVFYMLSRNM